MEDDGIQMGLGERRRAKGPVSRKGFEKCREPVTGRGSLTFLLSSKPVSSDQPGSTGLKPARPKTRAGLRVRQGRPPSPTLRSHLQPSFLTPPAPRSTPKPPTSAAAGTALGPFPSPPPWGADSPGCHVSLLTSPGPLGLSQSARGSPSEVLASESTGRGSGRGGGWGGEGVGNGAGDKPARAHAPKSRGLAGSGVPAALLHCRASASVAALATLLPGMPCGAAALGAV